MRRLLTTAVTVAVFLAVVEVAFRVGVFPRWRDVTWATFQRHPVYGTFQKPNLSIRRLNPPNYDVVNTTNSMGFRDREDNFKDDLNGIWLAGMSNTYGGFVDDDKIYSARLQARGFLVANLSSEGHLITNQIQVMRHLAILGYRPKAVILEVTLNNSLFDYRDRIAMFSERLIAPETPGAIEPGQETARQVFVRKLEHLAAAAMPSLISLKGLALNNSAVYVWTKVTVNSIPALRELALKRGLRADVALVDAVPPALLRDAPTTPHDVLIHSTADLLEAVGRWVADELKVPFGTMLIPSPHHRSRERFVRYLRHLGLTESEYDAARPYRLLLKALRAKGIPTLDMAPAMLAARGPLSFPDDGHMNATAHALVAENLAEFLAAHMGLAPKK